MDPLTTQSERKPELIEPRTPTEKLVAEVWCELLEVDAVDVTEDFFELGGHSLLAVQVVFQLSDRTGVELELEEFFDLGTIEEVAAQLDRTGAAGAGLDTTEVYEGEL
ncbi:Non-ribosomal peptide synthetase [Alloactinosynnema sp. L-07]|uniref:phosphopantetheine-binding protein n=1 Tax=Alloactinosynnema sp. L-07 TaxID=1653480 RepID=UPI00065EFF34|nr:phosphopantetheine-binding protein [Alloactinosynnema sp. L-07]CRK56744.1 Non-ribosomal peptide synthetase [Alloactinosynnema sp. L-07]